MPTVAKRLSTSTSHRKTQVILPIALAPSSVRAYPHRDRAARRHAPARRHENRFHRSRDCLTGAIRTAVSARIRARHLSRPDQHPGDPERLAFRQRHQGPAADRRRRSGGEAAGAAVAADILSDAALEREPPVSRDNFKARVAVAQRDSLSSIDFRTLSGTPSMRMSSAFSPASSAVGAGVGAGVRITKLPDRSGHAIEHGTGLRQSVQSRRAHARQDNPLV